MRRARKEATVLPLQKRILYSSTTVLWATGALWLYLPTPSDPQPFLMKVHGALGMLFLMVFGTLLFEHVPAGWLQEEHRVSGVGLLSACLLLIFSGWGLYYIGSDSIRLATHWIHSVAGLALPILIYLHVQMKRSTRGPVLEPTPSHPKNQRKGN